MKTQLFYCGNNAIDSLRNEINALKSKRVFLLSGKKSFTNCGAESLLCNLFYENNIDVIHWSDFKENPKIEDVEIGLKILTQSKADVIIACGGGSVIDMAKLIRFGYSYDGELTESNFTKIHDLLPLIAIPTTSGTGAEATPFAVCYKEGKKYSVSHEDILPDAAIIYPPFSYSNSPYLTACTGFDALAQATEAFWNVNTTHESDDFALKAIKLIHDNLIEACKITNNEIRDNLSLGAYYAGKAIAITKTTAPHAFSYAFTTHCNYPHGHAVALTFPFFFELNTCRYHGNLQPSINQNTYADRIKILHEIFNVTSSNCLTTLQTFIESIGLTNKGYNNQSLDYLLSQVNIQRLSNNPVLMSPTILDNLQRFLKQ